MPYLVVYAKVAIDKEGVKLLGIYYGGLGDTKEEAEIMARDCVDTVKGGTILPRITPLNEYSFIDTMYDMADRFEQIVKEMSEMHQTIIRSNSLRKK